MNKIVEKVLDFFAHIRNLFLSGLFTIIPIAATVFFINFAYNFSVRMLEPLRRLEPDYLQRIPGSEFVLIMIFILALGAILRFFIVHSVVSYCEEVIAKIPFIRIVYSSAKILVDFFKVSDSTKVGQRKVVLIPYPKKGQYHMAFLLEDALDSYQKVIPEAVKKRPDEKYYKVFMPNSPNPTTGYFFIMSEDDIIHTDVTFEEAIKVLVSCGLVTPESLKALPPLEMPLK
ncbi:MAG: DUF502 domain-containing protein [Epsilonproteobacteria bacterium]|nr:DUF502 domain-containing protein [Campylobacterota bacterium]